MLPSIILVLSLSISSSVVAVPHRRDEPLHIPIHRRHNERRQDAGIERFADAANALRAKYNMGQSSPQRRAQTSDIGITNQVCPSSATDSAIRLTTTRARIQVTLPKSTSAHRECETP
jgi:hypothetical protein